MPLAFFDVETRPDDTVELATPKARGNLKDLGKIAADLEEKAEKARGSRSLDPYACCVAAIAWTRTPREEHPIQVLTCQTEDEEREALATFVDAVRSCDLVGHNVRAFDLPVLITRCRALGVRMPFHWNSLRWLRNGSSILDLYEMATFGRGTRDEGVVSRGLVSLCKRFRVEPEGEDITGAEVAARWAAGDIEAVTRHCERDVIRTCALADVFDVVGARLADRPATEAAEPQGSPF